MSVEQKRMEEEAKRAAQRAVNQLRISRQNDRAGAGQVTLLARLLYHALLHAYTPILSSMIYVCATRRLHVLGRESIVGFRRVCYSSFQLSTCIVDVFGCSTE